MAQERNAYTLTQDKTFSSNNWGDREGKSLKSLLAVILSDQITKELLSTSSKEVVPFGLYTSPLRNHFKGTLALSMNLQYDTPEKSNSLFLLAELINEWQAHRGKLTDDQD